MLISWSPWSALAPYSVPRLSQSSLPLTGLSMVSCSYSTPPVPLRRSRVLNTRHIKSSVRAELVKDKEWIDRKSNSDIGAAFESGNAVDDEFVPSRIFLHARSQQELLSCVRKEQETGKLPPDIASRMEEVYHNYRDAVLQSGRSQAMELILSNISAVFDRIMLDIEAPFMFSSYHKAIREPFDYYMFGQNYIRPLLDLRQSYIGNINLFSEMESQLLQGHNIILISNHQTEADPAVISLLLEKTNPQIGEKMTYIAGDRVILDPVCKPFSMGRNLVCVYSKKHMYDVPEMVEMKRKANTRSMKELALLLRRGCQIIWIAPSGGRDRADPLTGNFCPAPFDAAAVENIRRLSDHSGHKGHIYPLALLCYEIMPPPSKVERDIGESRKISYHGVGLSVAEEISFDVVASGIDSREEARQVFSDTLYESIQEQYNVINCAIYGERGLDASVAYVSLSQPWL